MNIVRNVPERNDTKRIRYQYILVHIPQKENVAQEIATKIAPTKRWPYTGCIKRSRQI